MAGILSTKMDWMLANPLWAQILNPIIANPLNQVQFIEDVALINGEVTVPHRLGRRLTGWFLTDINAAAQVYRSQPKNDQTLSLTSNAAATATIGVF